MPNKQLHISKTFDILYLMEDMRGKDQGFLKVAVTQLDISPEGGLDGEKSHHPSTQWQVVQGQVAGYSACM